MYFLVGWCRDWGKHIKNLTAKGGSAMKFVVEGKTTTSGKVALDKGMFNACVTVGEQPVAQCQVDANGEFRIEFEAKTKPEMVLLMMMPSSVGPTEAGQDGSRQEDKHVAL